MKRSRKTERPARIDRVAVEIERHDVVGGDQRRRERTRHQKMVGVAGIARADMAETVEHAELGEDAAADHDILGHSSIARRRRGGRRLGVRLRQNE